MGVLRSTAVLLAATSFGFAACGSVGEQPTSDMPVRTPPSQCRLHLTRSLIVSPGNQAYPLHLRAGSKLWVRLAARTPARWSRPISGSRGVARFSEVSRCPSGSVVALLHAGRPGVAMLVARWDPNEPDPGPAEWRQRVTVSRQHPGHGTPPANSRLLRGGGLLTFPDRLNLEGTDMRFRVPQVACRPGRGGRVDIGLSGVKQVFRPSGRSRTEQWFAGLTVRCHRTGAATYHVGYDHQGGLGTTQPGDVVDVGSTGTSCPGVDVGVSRGANAWESQGVGCRVGRHDRIRVIAQPYTLFGARVVGLPPRPLHLRVHPVNVNLQPYRLVPHVLRTQRSGDHVVVTPETSPDWYRITVAIG